MSFTSQGSISCPVCGDESVSYMPVSGWGEMRRCTGCSLVFANPMSIPENAVELFSKAYEGKVQFSRMTDFSERLPHRELILKCSKSGVWSPAYRLALTWLRQNLPQHSTILDIGCGSGVFLDALKEHGFKAIGLDVAMPAVTALREQGFEVWHGEVKSYPTSWPEPVAVCSFFALHHMVNPMDFLSTIHRRWPNAPFLLSEWLTSDYYEANDEATLPPRTLTWWTPQALAVALKHGGYRASVSVPLPSFAEHRMLPSRWATYLLRELKKHPKLGLLFSLYLHSKRYIGAPWSLWRRLIGKPDSCIFAIALPQN